MSTTEDVVIGETVAEAATPAPKKGRVRKPKAKKPAVKKAKRAKAGTKAKKQAKRIKESTKRDSKWEKGFDSFRKGSKIRPKELAEKVFKKKLCSWGGNWEEAGAMKAASAFLQRKCLLKQAKKIERGVYLKVA